MWCSKAGTMACLLESVRHTCWNPRFWIPHPGWTQVQRNEVHIRQVGELPWLTSPMYHRSQCSLSQLHRHGFGEPHKRHLLPARRILMLGELQRYSFLQGVIVSSQSRLRLPVRDHFHCKQCCLVTQFTSQFYQVVLRTKLDSYVKVKFSCIRKEVDKLYPIVVFIDCCYLMTVALSDVSGTPAPFQIFTSTFFKFIGHHTVRRMWELFV